MYGMELTQSCYEDKKTVWCPLNVLNHVRHIAKCQLSFFEHHLIIYDFAFHSAFTALWAAGNCILPWWLFADCWDVWSMSEHNPTPDMVPGSHTHSVINNCWLKSNNHLLFMALRVTVLVAGAVDDRDGQGRHAVTSWGPARNTDDQGNWEAPHR
jgi:hypothetical protein